MTDGFSDAQHSPKCHTCAQPRNLGAGDSTLRHASTPRRAAGRPPHVKERHLLLAGCGHAHLDLLALFVRGIPRGWRVTLVVPQPDFHYSGMLPVIMAGAVPPSAADIPVARIAAAAGINVQLASVAALDVAGRTVTLDDGRLLAFDLLSLDVGSVAAATDICGARSHAWTMRPFTSALALLQRLNGVIATGQPRDDVPVAVVGGGAAGVEIALALRARIARAGLTPRVTLIDSQMRDGLPLPGFSPAFRRKGADALISRCVQLRGAGVQEVTDANVVLDDHAATLVASVATAWVTGAAPHPWLTASGLPCDARGFPLVSEKLTLTDDASIFGAGDCITLRGHLQTPKAGVHAVRMAPVLAANVLAVMQGRAPTAAYHPPRSFLALLSTSDGAALLRWQRVALEARWAQNLKTWIDERYLHRYRMLAPP